MVDGPEAGAPLLSIPGALRPERGEAYWLTARDGLRLRAAVFQPHGAPRGSVILSPGRTEPIEKYYEVIGELQTRGFVILIHDWRGQGLSTRLAPDPLLGHARGWRPFIADLDDLLTAFASQLPRPWIALGHSMGGGLTSLALAEGEGRFAAAVLSAPMLGVNTGERTLASVQRIAWLMTFVGRSRMLAAPATDPLEETFASNILTHDQARWDRFHAQILAKPELRLGGITWGWLAFALILSERVKASRRIEQLSIPFVVVAAEAEKLVVNAAARAVAERAPLGRYLEVPGAFHEILMETNARRAMFWSAFDQVARTLFPGVVPSAPPVAGARAQTSKGAPKRPRAPKPTAIVDPALAPADAPRAGRKPRAVKAKAEAAPAPDAVRPKRRSPAKPKPQ